MEIIQAGNFHGPFPVPTGNTARPAPSILQTDNRLRFAEFAPSRPQRGLTERHENRSDNGAACSRFSRLLTLSAASKTLPCCLSAPNHLLSTHDGTHDRRKDTTRRGNPAPQKTAGTHTGRTGPAHGCLAPVRDKMGNRSFPAFRKGGGRVRKGLFRAAFVLRMKT